MVRDFWAKTNVMEQPQGVTVQYFSKWRNQWVWFSSQPTPGQLAGMRKYHYQIREI